LAERDVNLDSKWSEVEERLHDE